MFPKGFGMLRLNLGAGLVTPSDWINVDKYPTNGDVIGADILEGLPFKDNYFDFVLMNHTLQVFTYNELPYVLQEVKRVMKEGSILRILTPDLDRAVHEYNTIASGYFDEFIPDTLEPTIAGKFARYLFWHGETRCAFNYTSLLYLLRTNGFMVNEELGKFGDCELDSRQNESLIMVCQK